MTRTSPRSAGRAALLASGLTVFSMASPQPPTPAAPSAVSLAESGVWGGGLLTTIVQDPADPTKYLVGGDVSGFHASADDGVTWLTSNGGLNTGQEDTISAVTYRRFNERRHTQVYAAFGANGGGVLRSDTGGGSWIPFGPGAADGGPIFQGHDPCGLGPYPEICTDPRPTGSLLVLDETAPPHPRVRFVYAGTFGRGIMRTDPFGSVWTTIALGAGTTRCLWNGLAGCYITTLVADPRVANVLYVGTHGNGAYKVTGTDCTGDGCAEANVTAITAGNGSDPIVDAEELWFQRTTEGVMLMCACGKEGFYRGGAPFTTLDQSNTGIDFDLTEGHETSYSAIGGRSWSSDTPIYIGDVNAACEVIDHRNQCHTVYRSTDGGVTWSDVVFGGDVQKTVAGTTIDWWEFMCCSSNLINQASYQASAIALTASDPPEVLVAGRSGVWRTTSEGDTHWQPAVQGMGTTANADVIADPRNADRVYVGALDWTVFASASRLDPGTTVQSDPNASVPEGFAVAVDQQVTDPISPVYLAGGGLTEDTGDVFISTDPTQPGTDPWTSLAFAATDCDRTTPRVIGVGVGRLTPTATPLVYAATDGCGLWRFDGAAWQKVSSGTDMFATKDPAFRFAPISYPDNLGRLLFVFDRQTGRLWESNNQGSPGSWVQVWQVPPTEEVDASTGFMVDDPNDRGTVWVTTGSPKGLHQLACPIPPVPDGCVDTITPPANVVNPGPITLRPCPGTCTPTVYVATRAVDGDPTPVALFKHLSGNTSWCDLTSSSTPQYRRSANFPSQIAASLDTSGVTTVYVTTAGEGILVVSDDTTDCVP